MEWCNKNHFLPRITLNYQDLLEKEKLFSLGEKFLNLKTDKPQVLYVWGHSYEMDAEYISWQEFEEFCKMISEKEDIFYGTNGQIFLQ